MTKLYNKQSGFALVASVWFLVFVAAVTAGLLSMVSQSSSSAGKLTMANRATAAAAGGIEYAKKQIEIGGGMPANGSVSINGMNVDLSYSLVRSIAFGATQWPPSYVSGGAWKIQNNTTSITVDLGTGGAAGDLYLVTVYSYGLYDIPTPDGWNILYKELRDGRLAAIYYKIRGDTAEANPVFTKSTVSGYMVGKASLYTNVDSNSPFVNGVSYISENSKTYSCGTLTVPSPYGSVLKMAVIFNGIATTPLGTADYGGASPSPGFVSVASATLWPTPGDQTFSWNAGSVASQHTCVYFLIKAKPVESDNKQIIQIDATATLPGAAIASASYAEARKRTTLCWNSTKSLGC